MDKLLIWKFKKKELGYTNQNIATKAELPLRTVEQIMCGKVKHPRLDTVQAIDRALGISTESEQADKLTAEERELLNYFRALNPTMRKYALEIIKAALSTQDKTAVESSEQKKQYI